MKERESWLIQRACIYTGADPDKLYTKAKKRDVVFARFIVWYNLFYHSAYTLQRAADIFGKDHATVINGIKKYGFRRDTELDFREFVDDIEKMYMNKFPRISRDYTSNQLLSNQIFKTIYKSKYAIGKLLIR